MAYLRWSSSNWHAYWQAGTPPGDEAVLTVHGHVHFALRAGELVARGCRGNGASLRRWILQLFKDDERIMRTTFADWVELSGAVDDFLREVYEGGRIPVPAQVARRHRVLSRWLERAWTRVKRRWIQDADADSIENLALQPLLAGIVSVENELAMNRRRYPGPNLPQDIVALMDLRARRMLRGEGISLEQEASERQRIELAYGPIRDWPIG